MPSFNTFNKDDNSLEYKKRTFFYAEFREAVQVEKIVYVRSTINDMFSSYGGYMTLVITIANYLLASF